MLGHIGRFLLSGLSSAGALILLFIGLFGDPIATMGKLYSAFADAQAPVLQSAVTPSPIEVVELAAVSPPDRDEEENGRHDQVDVAAPQKPPALTLTAMSAVTPPAHPERLGKRGWQHGRGGSLNAYVAQSRRGTWLFPPNPNN